MGRPLPPHLRKALASGADVTYRLGTQGDATVEAIHRGQVVGSLTWAEDGEIMGVNVHPDHQRRGVASGMLAHARRIDPGVRHSDNLTLEGRGWAGVNP